MKYSLPLNEILRKSILFLLFFALSPVYLIAETVTIDGINYNLNESNKTAEVTKGSYSGIVTIPSSISYKNNRYRVTSIGNSAFSDCKGLTSVTIPNSITSIGNSAFSDCWGLTSVTIPNSVTAIGNDAFSGCLELTSVTIPNSVTSISNNAFSGCHELTSVTIPNSVSSIEEEAFSFCTSLTRISIPHSVTSIGKRAFAECSGLTSITIPNSVSSIGEEAFSRCANLIDIKVETENKYYLSIEGVLFSKDKTTIVSYPGGRKGSYIIPNTVTSIGDGAFSFCDGLTNITIPNSVTSIGEHAFSGCSVLTSVTIPNSVTSIGNAFSVCIGLTSITIPNSVTSIGNSAFYWCSELKEIEIPYFVTSIGENAFFNCYNLKSITLYNGSKLSESNFPASAKIIYKDFKRISWKELNKKMLSWDEYYNKNKKEKLTFNDIKAIEAQINADIEKWQIKDEFESTQSWQSRVNEQTRKEKAAELSAKYLNIYKNETAKLKEDQQQLAEAYEQYKEELLSDYYLALMIEADKNFNKSEFTLKPYDADNGSFMISSAKYGDILLPVPLDEAPSFKENWQSIRNNIKPEFVPNGKDVALNKIIFTNNGKSYVYDTATPRRTIP